MSAWCSYSFGLANFIAFKTPVYFRTGLCDTLVTKKVLGVGSLVYCCPEKEIKERQEKVGKMLSE